MKNFKLISLLLICSFALQGQVIIRPAVAADIPALIAFDRAITYEYFVPLVPQYYQNFFTLDQYAQEMEYELNVMDPDLFKKAIDQVDNIYLHVAVNEENQDLVAFNLFSQIDDTLNLDLILVAKDYRNKGICSKFIQTIIENFSEIKMITTEVLQCNLAACKAYEKIGFKNTGPGSADKTNCFGFGLDKWIFVYKLHLK